MRRTVFSLLLFAVTATASSAFAAGEVSETGSVGMSFLKIDPSARIAALGGGTSAYFTGASSLWANPALLARSEERAVQFTHLEWIAGITQEFAAVSLPSSLGHFGLGVQVIDSDDIDGRDTYGAQTGPYSITNTALSLTYAATVVDLIHFGATFKKLYEKVSMDTADGYAVDFGLFAMTPVEGLGVGVTGRNYGRMGRLRNDRTKLPSDVALGCAYASVIPRFGTPVDLVADYIVPRYGDAGVRLGAAAHLSQMLALRMGYRSDSDIQYLSFGLGVGIDIFAFDVSYAPMREGFDDAVRLSFDITGF